MSDTMPHEQSSSRRTHCGFIAIVGRPNVGKSTLLNHLLEQKISITSRKPQTTRHRILGIKTVGDDQFVYVDTPGMHKVERKAINRVMNQAATSALDGVDIVRDVDVQQVLHLGSWEQAVANGGRPGSIRYRSCRHNRHGRGRTQG